MATTDADVTYNDDDNGAAFAYVTPISIDSIPGDKGTTKTTSGTFVISVLDLIIILGVAIAVITIIATGNINSYLLLLLYNIGHVFYQFFRIARLQTRDSQSVQWFLLGFFIVTALADLGALFHRSYLLVTRCLVPFIDTGTCDVVPLIQELVFWVTSFAFFFITIGYIGNTFTEIESLRSRMLSSIHLTLAAKILGDSDNNSRDIQDASTTFATSKKRL